MFDRFEVEAKRVLVVAEAECRDLRSGAVGVSHLLLGTLAAEDRLGHELRAAGARADRARELLRQGSEWALTAYRPPFTDAAKQALLEALRESLRLRSPTIRPAHLLLGVIAVDDGVVLLLEQMAVDVPALAVLARSLGGAESSGTDDPEPAE